MLRSRQQQQQKKELKIGKPFAPTPKPYPYSCSKMTKVCFCPWNRSASFCPVPQCICAFVSASQTRRAEPGGSLRLLALPSFAQAVRVLLQQGTSRWGWPRGSGLLEQHRGVGKLPFRRPPAPRPDVPILAPAPVALFFPHYTSRCRGKRHPGCSASTCVTTRRC